MSKPMSAFARSQPTTRVEAELGLALRLGLLAAIALAGGFAARLI